MSTLILRATGVSALRARLLLAASSTSLHVSAALATTTQELAAALSGNAPVGAGGISEPPVGDAPGELRTSFVSEMEPLGESAYLARVRTVQPLKLRFVRYGTGIYGPLGQRIYPRRASALRWVGPDGTVYIRRSVAGMRPNDFVTPLVVAAQAQARDDLALALEAILSALR